jgi:hypothetical protein
MKRFTKIILINGLVMPFIFFSASLSAQVKTQQDVDTLKQKVMTINDKVAGVEERISNAEADLAKLTKIKFSGYIQSQWINYEASNVYPNNYFMIRRARFTLSYEPVDGVVFVMQPDFAPGNFTIKEAYAKINDPWLKTFSIWAGKFVRPDYEITYSSANREVAEFSRVIKALYPDEYAIGAKLEIAPPKLPLLFQLAVINGNDGYTTVDPTGTSSVLQNTDYDNFKDLTARLTYRFKLGNFGGLTIGALGYYGSVKANSLTVLKSDYTVNKTLTNVGQSAPKQWWGAEMQFNMDVLGGLIIKGEYLRGILTVPGITSSSSTLSQSVSASNDTLFYKNLTTTTKVNTPAISRNFSGWYLYLIKNIGKRNQIAVRYDWYNPNTKLSADSIGSRKYSNDTKGSVTTSKTTYSGGSSLVTATQTQSITNTTSTLKSGTADIPYGSWDFAYSYYFTDNIKIMVDYLMPLNKKVGTVNSAGAGNVTSTYTTNGINGVYDYSNLIHQNVLTVRVQVKF